MPTYWCKNKCRVMFKDQDLTLPKGQVFISILFNLKNSFNVSIVDWKSYKCLWQIKVGMKMDERW